ncbi:MAG: two-component system response regulator [Bacteroidota bacterium]|jgi:CheY-like chemotaxis protein|nr:two-component system response regulator [Bacteroidota bacterium]
MNLEEIEIILVEDNPDDAFFTKRAFIDANVNNNIIILTDGEEAIDFFFNDQSFSNQTFHGKTRLLMLDMNLPKVSGMEILKRMKTHQTTKHIPIIVLTASDNDPMMEEALSLGAESYIIKPVTYEGFIEVINKISRNIL